MNTTAHNHPPRCCCNSSLGVKPNDSRPARCPLCIEHGELAQLAENREYPGQPGEKVMPCCNQLAGRPHTDYCRACTCGRTDPATMHRSGCRLLLLEDDLPTNQTPEQARANVAAGMHTTPAKAAQPPIDSWPEPGPPCYVELPDGTTKAAVQCIDPECIYPNPHTHPDLIVRRSPRTIGDNPQA